MSWVTVVCSMVAAGCLTLSAVHLGVWWRDRASKANLSFSVLALGVALFTWAEFAVTRTRTVEEYGAALWWVHPPIFIMVASIVWFVRHHFGTGRTWLGHAAWLLRAMNLAVNFWQRPNVDFAEITDVRLVSFLGETVAVGEGVTSAWFWQGHLAFAALLLFVIDASMAHARRGHTEARRRAWALGGTMALFILGGAASAALIFANLVDWPHVEFLLFLPVLAVMAHQLSGDVLAAAELARRLQVSEAEARELSGRVITAQEDERRRVARELHDDLSQRLALLSVDVELLSRADVEGGNRARLDQMAANVRGLSADMHRLSYELHPAKLDQLGLVAAVQGWVRDLARQSAVAIDFEAADLPATIGAEARLCLYRIVQEALNNVVRHSGATSARVRLSASDGSVRLEVTDDGRGFDVAAARSTAGLGLVGMRERVRLVRGTLSVRSTPGSGTRIDVAVPVTQHVPH